MAGAQILTMRSQLPVDVRLSRQVGKAFRARCKQCFSNCHRVVIHTSLAADGHDGCAAARLGPALLEALRGALYVEGIVVRDGIMPIEHAWIETQAAIVEPKLVLPPPRRIRHLVGDEDYEPSRYRYFPGRRLASRDAARLLRERKGLPLTFDRWPQAPDLAFIRAWEAAYSYVQGRPVTWGHWATGDWAERMRAEAEQRAREDGSV